MTILNRFEGYSRAVILIDGGLTFLFVGGFRLFIRFFFKEFLMKKTSGQKFNFFKDNQKKLILVYGAGNTGEKILRELNDNPRLNYTVVGFLDDDKHKWRRSIHGVPILGGIKQLAKIKKRYNAQEVLIAVPSATGNQMRAIVDACKTYGLSFKTMPGMEELINGKISIKALRDVRYRDLLRRDPVKLDSDKISDYLTEKTIMVTGAGGSIGSELCRQIIRFQPKQLILFDASEPSLYSIQMELKHRVEYQNYITVLGRCSGCWFNR